MNMGKASEPSQDIVLALSGAFCLGAALEGVKIYCLGSQIVCERNYRARPGLGPSGVRAGGVDSLFLSGFRGGGCWI